MNRIALVKRVRSLTRDFSNSIFREQDIIDFINEGIDRFQQIVPELEGMPYLLNNDQSPNHLPERFHHMLSVYSASRCFSQDERHYQATTLMNEFEAKLDELKNRIEAGEIVITDPVSGEPVERTYEPDYVVDNYFSKRRSSEEGVE